VTLHRPANVDNVEKLAEIMGALSEISTELPLYWPVHPRTRSSLENQKIGLAATITLLEPLSYFDFLNMQATAVAIFTDSGGVQEESTVLGIPCFTIRENTERPATIDCGTNHLAGTKKESILRSWRDAGGHRARNASIPPLWDGKAGERCRQAIKHFYTLRATQTEG
jgi:UDP-N-acetylglucosamine 2-epimerase (non-hydrolysing)